MATNGWRYAVVIFYGLENTNIMIETKKYKEYKEALAMTDVYDKEFLKPFSDWVDGYEHAMSAVKNIAVLPLVSQRSELLAFKQFISKTPLAELELYSDEEFTNLYIKANCG